MCGDKMNIGFFGILQIVFIALKVTDYLDWSWFQVFTPFYIWFVLYVIAIALNSWLDKNDPLRRFRK